MELKFYLDKKVKLVGKRCTFILLLLNSSIWTARQVYSKIPVFLYCETDENKLEFVF